MDSFLLAFSFSALRIKGSKSIKKEGLWRKFFGIKGDGVLQADMESDRQRLSSHKLFSHLWLWVMLAVVAISEALTARQ